MEFNLNYKCYVARLKKASLSQAILRTQKKQVVCNNEPEQQQQRTNEKIPQIK